jgi:drug/metabolite transporter (DMT)-like permease
MSNLLLRTYPYLSLVAVIAANVAANVFMKIGSTAPVSQSIFFGVFGWQTLFAIGLFGSGVIFYGLALKTLPLYAAQSIIVLQFVGVVLMASLLFKEPIDVRQWAGIALIVLGLTLVAGPRL